MMWVSLIGALPHGFLSAIFVVDDHRSWSPQYGGTSGNRDSEVFGCLKFETPDIPVAIVLDPPVLFATPEMIALH